MKFLLLLFALYFSTISFSQNQNKTIGFIENKGQIIDQKGKENKDVLYLLNTPGLNVQLKKSSFSYDVYETKKHPLSKKEQESRFKSSFPEGDTIKNPNYKLEYIHHRIDIDFKDKTGIDHDKFSFGLKKSLFNYMHNIGFDFELQDWFDFKIPKTKIADDFIVSCLEKIDNFNIKPSSKIIWLGGKPVCEEFTKSKKGNSWQMTKLTFHDKKETFEILLEKEKADWLKTMLQKVSISNFKATTFNELKIDFETHFEDFELFWYSKPINTLRDFGLLVL